MLDHIQTLKTVNSCPPPTDGHCVHFMGEFDSMQLTALLLEVLQLEEPFPQADDMMV